MVSSTMPYIAFTLETVFSIQGMIRTMSVDDSILFTEEYPNSK